MEGKEKKIELRSPKVKNIIGEVPPTIVRVGNAVITSILITTFLIVFYLPMPWTISSDIYINMNSNILYIPLRYNNYLHNNPKISVEVDAFYTINNKPIELTLTFTGDTVVYKSHLYIIKEFEDKKHEICMKPIDNEILKAKMYIEKGKIPLLRRFM